MTLKSDVHIAGQPVPPHRNIHADEIGFDGNTDFADEGYLNTCGSNKVADFLREYLIENYNLTDYRSKEGNLWERAQQRSDKRILISIVSTR